MVRVGMPAVLAAACLIGGCSSFLPAAGPTASAVVEGADVATDQGLLARYEIVDVDAAVVEALRGRPLDSLLASFGDRRPSVQPVIGVGDGITVTIWEAGSGGLFSGPMIGGMSTGSKSSSIPEQIVARDGTISVPYAGRIKVAGKRAADVQAQIEQDLAGKAIQPQVLITVNSPLSTSVTVLGEAASTGGGARLAAARGGPASSLGGGRVPLTEKGDRLLDVIATAGGVSAPVNETFVRLSRGSATATVPLTAVVSNPRENIFLRPGDTLTLVRDPQTFLAVGATGANYEIPFSAEGITLAQALAKSGGCATSRPIRPACSCSGSSRPRWCAACVRAARSCPRTSCRWSTGSTCAIPTACSSPRPSGCATATSSTSRTPPSPRCRRC